MHKNTYFVHGSDSVKSFESRCHPVFWDLEVFYDFQEAVSFALNLSKSTRQPIDVVRANRLTGLQVSITVSPKDSSIRMGSQLKFKD